MASGSTGGSLSSPKKNWLLAGLLAMMSTCGYTCGIPYVKAENCIASGGIPVENICYPAGTEFEPEDPCDGVEFAGDCWEPIVGSAP